MAAVEIGRALEALVKNNLCDKNLPIEVIYNKSGFAEKKVMIEDQENKGNNTDSIDSFLDKKLFEIEIGKAVDNLRKFISDEINMNIEKHFVITAIILNYYHDDGGRDRTCFGSSC